MKRSARVRIRCKAPEPGTGPYPTIRMPAFPDCQVVVVTEDGAEHDLLCASVQIDASMDNLVTAQIVVYPDALDVEALASITVPDPLEKP